MSSMVPNLTKLLEQDHALRQTNVDTQLINIKINIRVILDQYNTLNLLDIPFCRREEIKTILEIFQALLTPLFDFHHDSLIKQKEKQTMLISITKITKQLEDVNDKYNQWYKPSQYNEEIIYPSLTNITKSVFSILQSALDPKWPLTTRATNELTKTLKQLTAFELVLTKFPALTKHSRQFIKTKFKPIYTRISAIQELS